MRHDKTEKFLDTEIESKIILKVKGLLENKIEAFFELNDELIKIKYDGNLDIDLYNKRKNY